MQVLREQIGKDVWMIMPTFKPNSNSGLTDDWTQEQLDWLEHKFTGKVGIISLSPNQEDDSQKFM